MAAKSAKRLAVRAALGRRAPGESVSVNGACLTVVRSRGKILEFDVSPETWRRTALGELRLGGSVNLEPALKAGDSLGGHFVTGHVDAAAKILALDKLRGGFALLRVEIPEALSGLVAEKGSVAVDGISLTVSKAAAKFFEVALIPHTLASTNLAGLCVGRRVNLEADVLARYLAAFLRAKK
ncbi:MAG TPA: riboflavin synthase [Elusimicrobiota bacterium]|nr:riboflavin synthase [Elusimicrobiota bacterium]